MRFPTDSRTTVVLRRAGVLAAVTTGTLLVSASSASALSRDDGDDPGPGLNVFQTIGIFVGIPLAIALVIGVLVYASSLSKGPRYRPGWAWWHDSVWFGANAEPMRSVDPGAGVTPQASTLSGGGASARW